MSSGVRVSVGVVEGVALGTDGAGIDGVGVADAATLGTVFGMTLPLFQTNFFPDLMHVY